MDWAAARCPNSELAEYNARKECTEGEGNAEQLRGPVGDADGERKNGEREQLSGPGACHLLQQPWDDPGTKNHCQGNEGRDLAQRDGEGKRQRAAGARCLIGRGLSARHTGEGRQQHEHEHHHEVFDNEPSDGDAA